MSDTVIKTRCEGCIWCVCLDEFHQTGCLLGKLEKHRSLGVEIEEDNGFFVINKRGCLFRRTEAWWQAHGEIKDDLETLYELCRDEIKLDVTALVILKDNDLDKLGVTLDSLHTMTIRPVFIIILSAGTLKIKELMSYLHNRKMEIPYRFESVVGSIDERRVVDVGAKKAKSRWVATFLAGFEPAANFIEEIDCLINDDLRQIVLIKPEDTDPLNGLFFLRILAKQIGYNNNDLLENKVKRACESQQVNQLITSSASLRKI